VSAERQARLREGLASENLDALLVTGLDNIRYLTGYVGSNALALVGQDTSYVMTDSRYAVSATEQVSSAEVVIGGRDLLVDVARVLEGVGGAARIGVEADHLSVSRHDRITTALDEHELVSTQNLVEDLRVVKDAAELDVLRYAAKIVDDALAVVAAEGFVGRTERAVAWDLETAIRDAGGEGSSFAPIVAAAQRGARPHAVPSDEPIPEDTLLVVDMGAIWQGYCSDMTRTFILGTPAPELREAYRLCHRAQRAAVEAARPGIAAADLDSVAREIISEGGMGEAFGHGLGHGVGLAVHERPGVRSEGRETITAGMAITIEPGIYLEGRGGVRIEDLVLVTDDGPEVISKSPIEEPLA